MADTNLIKELFFEDLYIGQKFISTKHTITEDEIINFANSYDPQVFHTNPQLAKDTFFKGLAASGWHTASISMRLMVLSFKVKGGLIGAGCDINWPIPTRPNDVLQVETEIIGCRESKSKPDRGLITIKGLTYNQNHEIVQILTSKIVVLKTNA